LIFSAGRGRGLWLLGRVRHSALRVLLKVERGEVDEVHLGGWAVCRCLIFCVESRYSLKSSALLLLAESSVSVLLEE